MRRSRSPGKESFKVKRWLKRHGARLVVILGLLAIANAVWGLTKAIPQDREGAVIIHLFAIIVWAAVIFVSSGLANRIFTWWDKD
mgnify:CR=1 FL=1